MTQVSEISFCSRIGYNIKTDESKSRLLEELEQKFNFKVIQKHFDKFTPNHIDKLNNNPHMISVRTNGNPYLLYLTKINYINQCVFIDKKVQSGYFLPRIILSKFHFDDDLYEGTLIDGEMVKDNDENWIYIMSDLLAINGRYLDNVNLVKRLNLLYEMFEKSYCFDEVDVCRFQIKKYFTYDKTQQMMDEFIPKLNYNCRGLYFKPLFIKFKDILYNFDDSLVNKVTRVKYKEVSNFLVKEEQAKLLSTSPKEDSLPFRSLERNCSNNSDSSTKRRSLDRTRSTDSTSSRNSFDNSTRRKSLDQMRSPKSTSSRNSFDRNAIDAFNTHHVFYIKKTCQPDVYELYGEQDDKCLGNAYIPTLSTSKMMRALFLNKNLVDKIKMNCIPSDKFKGKYVPVEEVFEL